MKRCLSCVHEHHEIFHGEVDLFGPVKCDLGNTIDSRDVYGHYADTQDSVSEEDTAKAVVECKDFSLPEYF